MASSTLDVAHVLINLAAVQRAQRNYLEAEALLRRAINIQQTILGHRHPGLLIVLQEDAEVLRKLKRKQEARIVEQQAKALLP